MKIVIVWYSRPGIMGTLINKNPSLWGQISWEKSSCMIISSHKWDNTSDKGGTYFQCLLLCYVQQSISTYILGNLHFTNNFFFRLKIFCSNFQTQSRGTHPTSHTFVTSKKKKIKVHNIREHVKKIIISINNHPTQKKGGGGTFDIVSPIFKKVGGTGLPATPPPPPPRICAHA